MICEYTSTRFMSRLLGSIVGAALFTYIGLHSSPAVAAGVRPFFDLSHPAGSPFPSDRFTVSDPGQNTGLRVNLPKPDCTVRITDCEHIALLNELDGFNLQPRLGIPFNGPIDLSSVTSASVFLVGLGDTLGGAGGGAIVGINQVVWDPPTNTLYAEVDELLDQHSRWALVVTTGVRDANGDPIEAGAFATFRHDQNFGLTKDQTLKAYRKTLIDTLDTLHPMGIDESRIAAMTVFTTQSATAVLEKIRDQIKAATPQAADFNLGPGGTRTVFSLSDVTAIAFSAQTGAGSPPTFVTVTVPLAALGIVPGVVETIAFGKYASPDYQLHPGEFIPQIATRSGVPVVQQTNETNEIFFNLVLPSGAKLAGGWPVAIFGHGATNDKNRVFFNVVAKMAEHGIATIGINAQGHGFGRLGTLTVS